LSPLTGIIGKSKQIIWKTSKVSQTIPGELDFVPLPQLKTHRTQFYYETGRLEAFYDFGVLAIKSPLFVLENESARGKLP